MICYLDSSALIKRYVLEVGSDEVERLLSEADAAGTAWISLVEVVAGLAKAARMSVLTSEEADSAIHSFRGDWPDLMRLQITELLLERAADLARQHGLRGYDAVQLAAATSGKPSSRSLSLSSALTANSGWRPRTQDWTSGPAPFFLIPLTPFRAPSPSPLLPLM